MWTAIEEPDTKVRELVELWRRTFGGPPSIIVEPEHMLALIESHAARSGADGFGSGQV